MSADTKDPHLYGTGGAVQELPAHSNGADTGGDVGAHPVDPTVGRPSQDESITKAVDSILYSDIGVNTLLNRLKQSIASARDFAGFLKKRSTLEEDHAQGIKKLCRSTHESIRRPDARHGTYLQQFEEVTKLHERMADNSIQFALSLHQMHEDLTELSNNMDRGRKHWKINGLAVEKKVQDAEAHMEKAKTKYDSLAEDLDRVKTGDKSAGRVFGIKGPKSAAQHEEDLQRKLQAADSDYASKVQIAQAQRQELETTLRPQAIKAIQDLIAECDSALTLQLQKFGTFNEKLLLGNGILIAPIKTPDHVGPDVPSLRDMVYKIDNDKDLHSYLLSYTSKVPPKHHEIKYIKHPTQAPTTAPAPAPAPASAATAGHTSLQLQRDPTVPISSGPPHLPSFSTQSPVQQRPSTPQGSTSQHPQQSFDVFNSYKQPPQQLQQAPSYGSPGQQTPQSYYQPPPQQHQGSPQNYPSSQPPHVQHQGTPQFNPLSMHAPSPQGTGDVPYSAGPSPTKPVFGMTLAELFERDGSPVPMVVYQCIQAVDLFGLDVEGIYRIPGTNSHIQQLKQMFDSNSANIDFRNPSAFQHDINSVAGLLKQFFRDLPDPLFTAEHYGAFIDAARIDDDTVRRDSLHAIINALPDPNYATLRALVLHLNRVAEHAERNRMNSGNLGICFAPTLMGPHRGQMADAGLQARVLDTILQNTYQIFDED
ncbi:Rho GTPase-like protein activator [Patellaria atrata CBS 101060]|uniref:Rho GTPase-like protein activator n=1 Tax=Patellaria atrata CBS 101060 TaxID=1346257 RepID=A0A9P4VKA9_9PEZI|nr:Rho GTPase-like protein activator [Patellaria atrata CBS 101060]